MEVKDLKIYNYFSEDKLLVEKVFNDFYKYIYTIVKNSSSILTDEDIEEVVNDVIITIWKNKNKLDINKKMSPYIAGITKNLIKKKCRDIKVLENIEDYQDRIMDYDDIELHYLKDERHENMINQLKKLKEEDRNIFILYYYNDMNIRNIANKMNMSESKIKSKLFRIRRKLKKYLKRRGG